LQLLHIVRKNDLFDGQLRFIGKFEAVAGKDLDTVVSKGLWEAEMTTPASARMLLVKKAMPGVGITPTRIAFTPMEQIPETSAFSNMYPERRVSFPMMIWGACPFR